MRIEPAISCNGSDGGTARSLELVSRPLEGDGAATPYPAFIDRRLFVKVASQPSEGDEREWWKGATDAGRYGLIAAAVGVPLLKRRWRGAIAAAGSLFVAHQMCTVLKHVVPADRPDGSDDQSFPSSHSLEAFSAAMSLAQHSGGSLGLPAFVAAGMVAYGRVRADKHHRRDTIAGGIAGVSIAWLATRTASRWAPQRDSC